MLNEIGEANPIELDLESFKVKNSAVHTLNLLVIRIDSKLHALYLSGMILLILR